jgi:hypothetical protein
MASAVSHFSFYRYFRQTLIIFGKEIVVDTVVLTDSDFEHIVYLAGCTLAKTPGKNNWVEEDAVGGLPEYICRIARAINRSDPKKSISQVIAIAVGRVKTWARGGGGVTAKTRAQAAKALAQWESKKKAAKSNNKKMKLTAETGITLFFANSYNIDNIRREYQKTISAPGKYTYVREMWNDHMIISEEDETSIEGGSKIYKVDYSVDKQGTPSFGDKVEMKMAYVPLSAPELQTYMTDAQLEKATLIPCTYKDRGTLSEMVRLASEGNTVDNQLVSFTADKPNLAALLSNR